MTQIEVGGGGPVVLTPEIGPGVLEFGIVETTLGARDTKVDELAGLAPVQADGNGLRAIGLELFDLLDVSSADGLDRDLAGVIEVNRII